MSFGKIMELYQLVHMVQAHYQQQLAWEDAADARIARARAEERAAAQLRAMLVANPSGSLGHARLNDEISLIESGLL